MIDNQTFQRKRVAFCTLGCKLNFSETSNMSRLMVAAGFARVDADDVADVYVINTCSVTEESNRKCRQMIKRCVRRNAEAYIVVTGCYAQLEADEVAQIEGVDLVLGSNEKNDIVEHLGNLTKTTDARRVVGNILKDKAFRPSFSSGDRTRTFLKIQDGCDYFCSYCTIPMARGTSRSDTIASTVAEAQRAVEAGAKEIILTGVNIGDFGRRHGQTFADLVRALEDVQGVERFRISSIEPNLLTEEIIDHVAKSQKFMPHFHIPLQSGSDAMLSLMRRRYDTELFRSRTQYVHQAIPHAFIGIDVIVGARGEELKYFEETKAFLESIDFAQLHVFSYSERPNTQALKITPIVDVAERHRRNAVLHELSERRRVEFYKRFVGTDAKVLLEANHGRMMSGFTENYLKIEVPFCEATQPNTIHNVHLQSLAIDGQSINAILI